MIYVLKHYSIASLLIYFCKTSYANIFFFQLFNEIFLLAYILLTPIKW